MSSKTTFIHSNYRTKLTGTILTVRTAKVGFKNKSCNFQAFYVPHKNSHIPPAKQNQIDENMYREIDTYKDSTRTVPEHLLIPRRKLDPNIDDMKQAPLSGVGYQKYECLDVSPLQRPNKVSAINGIKHEACGHFIDTISIGARDGVLIKVTGKLKDAVSFGEPIPEEGIFIRVRSTAPYHEIKMRSPNLEGISYRDARIEGRFDIITLKDAYALGIAPMRHNEESLFNEVFRGDLFEIREIHPETESKPVVTTVETLDRDGNKVQLRKVKRRRNVGNRGVI